MGIDYYTENKKSLNWPQDLNVKMFKGSILEWKKIFINSGFENTTTHQVCANKDWAGTLVVLGTKY